MRNEKLLRNKAVIKALSIGLAAMMAITPVVGTVDVYAGETDPEPTNPDGGKPSNDNTKEVEDKYEEAKEELVPEAPENADNDTVTNDDASTTETTTFSETIPSEDNANESTEVKITIEKNISADGNSEDIRVTTDETTTKTEETINYTHNSESVSAEDYNEKVAAIKSVKDIDGNALEFKTIEENSEDIKDELGNVIGKKTVITEEATYTDADGYTTTKTIKTTVVDYIGEELTAPNAEIPEDPGKISLGEATDKNTNTTTRPDGTIIIETSEKKVEAYKSEKAESDTVTNEVKNQKVSEKVIEVVSVGEKTVEVSEFTTRDEAEKEVEKLKLSEDEQKLVSIVQNSDGKFVVEKTESISVDDPATIVVAKNATIADFDDEVRRQYPQVDGWTVTSNTDATGSATWTLSKTDAGVTTTYTYTFTPEKMETTLQEESITTTDEDITADDFAKNHLSAYTDVNSGWNVDCKTEGDTTTWIITKKIGSVTTQHTFTFKATESTTDATSSTVITSAKTSAEFLAELQKKYADEIEADTATVTDNEDGTYTVVKNGRNAKEIVEEVYSFTVDSMDDDAIPVISAATWGEFKSKFTGNANASIDEDSKKCVVTTVDDASGKTTIVTYEFEEGIPVSGDIETVTPTKLNVSDYVTDLQRAEEFVGWEFSDIDANSDLGKATWTVSKSENGKKTDYKYSFSYAEGTERFYTPNAKDEASFEAELIKEYGEKNVIVAKNDTNGITTYTCSKEVDGLTQKFVYTSKVEVSDEKDFDTLATSVDEFKSLINKKYPENQYIIDYKEKVHDNKGNASDTYECTVKTKSGDVVAKYNYWVSPDERFKPELNEKSIDEYLNDNYISQGWTVVPLGNNQWKASKPQNDNHTYVDIITFDGVDETNVCYTDEEKDAWDTEIRSTHSEADGWTVTRTGDKWVAEKKFRGKVIDSAVYEITDNGTTKSITENVKTLTLKELLGDEGLNALLAEAPEVNASNFQSYTIISANDAYIGCHENGAVYAGGEIAKKLWDGSIDNTSQMNIDDWFGVPLYDSDGNVKLNVGENEGIEVKRTDKEPTDIKKYWNTVATAVKSACNDATEILTDGVYKVRNQIVANYDEWCENTKEDDKSFDGFLRKLNTIGALLTGNNNGFQPAQDGSGKSGDSNLIVLSIKETALNVFGDLGNLNVGLLLAPNADITVNCGNITGTVVGNEVTNNAEGHTNLRINSVTTKETKPSEKATSVSVETFKVNAKTFVDNMICTVKEPVATAQRVMDTLTSIVSGSGVESSAEKSTTTTTTETEAKHKTDDITDSSTTKTKSGEKKSILGFDKKLEKESSDIFGVEVLSSMSISNKKSVVILGKHVSESSSRVVIPPTPVTPPDTPDVPDTPDTPDTPTPPVTPPGTPDVPVTPGTPEVPGVPTTPTGVLGVRRGESKPAAAVLGARRGVLGEKRVLGARTEDTSNAAAAFGVILGSVALSGAWLTLRRKRKFSNNIKA